MAIRTSRYPVSSSYTKSWPSIQTSRTGSTSYSLDSTVFVPPQERWIGTMHETQSGPVAGGGTYTSTTTNDGYQFVDQVFPSNKVNTGGTYTETKTINGTGALELSLSEGTMQTPYTLTVTTVYQNFQWEEDATYRAEQEAVEVLRSRGLVAGKIHVEQMAVEVLRQNGNESSEGHGTGGFIPFIHL